MTELRTNIYLLPIPLPNSPLRTLNAYFIRGLAGERSLLIDTGFNHPACHEAMMGYLAELGADLNNTDIFLTHRHGDHSGLAGKLLTGANTLYCSYKDGEALVAYHPETYLREQTAISKMYGIPQERLFPQDLEYMKERRPSLAYGSSDPLQYTALEEGDCFHMGGYQLEVVSLPGHTPGLLGLWEREQRFLFCGDHVLGRISPNIVSWPDDPMDAIQTFMDNLGKVAEMDLEILYPGHRHMVDQPAQRALALIDHHHQRLEEVLSAVDGGAVTTYQVACGMKWSIAGGVVADFPSEQLWFAVSEAYAHCEHLYRTGRLNRTTVDGVYHFAKP